jgi:F420H2 dehydrogenase subunit N
VLQLIILALPFVMTAFIVVFEAIFPVHKYWFIRPIAVILPICVLAAEIILIWQPGANTEDKTFLFTQLSRQFITILFGVTAVSLLVAYATGFLRSGRYSPVTLAVCGAILAALYINNVFLGTLSFVAAEFFSIVAVVDVGTEDEERFVRSIKSAARYLIVTVLFGLLLFVAQVFLERLRLDPQQFDLIKIILALAVVGFALRLGIFPFNLWLPQVIEDAPPLASYLVIGLINSAAVIFLIDFFAKNPVLLANTNQAYPIMILGMAGAVLAGLFALVQDGFGKMLAYTASANLGLILFGAVSPHQTGQRGTIFEVANFIVMQLLIFASLSMVAYSLNGRSLAGLTGLGRRMPVAALGLLIGFLGMVGMPLTGGFVGKYLILQSAAQEGLIWVLAGGASLFLMLLAYLKYFHAIFMGRDVPGLKTLSEPGGSVAVILTLSTVIIVVGVYPALLLDWFGTALK